MKRETESVSLGEVLRGVAQDRPQQALLLKMLRAVRSHLGMDVAFISHFTGGRRIFRFVDSDLDNQPVKEGAGDPLEESYCQRVVDRRLPELIPDASLVPEALELPVTKALPVGAHLSVPVRLSNGTVYGTFCCFSFKPDHSLNERDLSVMRVFADLTSDYIEKDLVESSQRRQVEARIKAVLNGDGVTSVYQPIVELKTGRPVGFECLSRFSGEPRQGPDVWFAEAASVGLGLELELKAVEWAFQAFQALPSHVYLAANLSPDAILIGKLESLLSSMPKDRTVLEITEHATVTAYEEIAKALHPLRVAGARIAVDDAGAGYASFRHILRLQPDYIKLDRSLISNIETDPARRALAAAFIRFGDETGSKIVAEGVETRAELDALRALGVSKAQGYFFGKPAPLSAVQSLF